MGEKTQKCMKGNSPQIYLYVQWKVFKIPTGIFVEGAKLIVKHIWKCKRLRMLR